MEHVNKGDSTAMLDAALQAALAAGREILDVYNGAIIVEYKDDRSPLTEADKRAHAVIAKTLSTMVPEIPVLSEEAKALDYISRQVWEQYWLVDPLDGTKEFIKRNGEFTVNIALMHPEGKTFAPYIGVVYVPVQDTLYAGIVGMGAWRCRGASKVNMLDFGFLEKNAEPLPYSGYNSGAIKAVVSRSHNSAETEALVAELEQKYGSIERVSSGSSIKLCLVAEGSADIYPRFAPTMEWDTAAGDAVCRAAGCRVTQQDRKTPLEYNKENLLNPWFLVLGPRIHL